jgi:ribonuclease E
MTKRMLIDATHAEETRVVVLDGTRLEEFDVETSTKKQLKGNIYLAKVVRVEPSLQAAFVEYGGGRHGFLAFGEIHPDYYQIPVADRQRLLAAQAAEAAEEDADEDDGETEVEASATEAEAQPEPTPEPAPETTAAAAPAEPEAAAPQPDAPQPDAPQPDAPQPAPDQPAPDQPAPDQPAPAADATPPRPDATSAQPMTMASETRLADAPAEPDLAPGLSEEPNPPPAAEIEQVVAEPAPPPEQLNNDTAEYQARKIPQKWLRNYKIQEVIKRRQILLVQVVKEERGTKGAALTTYISLAGRYSVLMPNSPRGGGVSRKITSAADRKRLREIATELNIPDGMGMIVRTAGAQRPKPEIKRDCEYLLRLWDNIRETTLASTAPALIHEEASLIKRSIRDIYARDIEEILVDGEDAYRQAKDFMRMIMPSHARKVQPYRDPALPLFAKERVESQLDAMHSPTVQLKSGGYIVINQTEALVAIDVNSGRSTRERGIEETALRTNLEAADEVARQLRLRDLAGLIVIDFIDMEVARANAQVERRLKDALKNDRARIQLGRISHFGLMEMSRQRLRPSLTEQAFVTCPHCTGTGLVRTTEGAAIQVLRAIEEESAKHRAAEIVVHCANALALYLLNHKRARLTEIHSRTGMMTLFAGDDSLLPPAHRIERTKAATMPPPADYVAPPPTIEPEDSQEPESADIAFEDDQETEAAPEPRAAREPRDARPPRPAAEEGRDGAEGDVRRRRRRRRRGGRREDGGPGATPGAAPGQPAEAYAEGEGDDGDEDTTVSQAEGQEAADNAAEPGMAGAPETTGFPAPESDESAETRRRRRGRRGGRRRRREDGSEAPGTEEMTAEADEAPVEVTEPAAAPTPAEAAAPRWSGPTPADPFGGNTFSLFDAMEAQEMAAERALARAPAPPPAPAATAAPDKPAEPTPEAPAEPAPEPVAAAEAPPQQSPAAVAPPPAAEAPVAEPAAPQPAIQPILVGTETPADAPKRRGWWRRG